MRTATLARIVLIAVLALIVSTVAAVDEPTIGRKAFIDGTGPDWRTLGEADFVNVNTDPGTWTWKDDGVHCTGKPVGVTRSQKKITNFELMAEWRDLQAAGNSGILVTGSEKATHGV